MSTTNTCPYHITVPRVDVYNNGGNITFRQFQGQMLSIADEWGERAIGRQVVQGKVPARDNDEFLILAIGTFDNRKFVVVSLESHERMVTGHDYDDDLDVT